MRANDAAELDEWKENGPAKTVAGRLSTGWLQTSIVAASLLLIGAVIFREFLFGNHVLLYKDIGADSTNDTFPSFVHVSDYIRHHGFLSWSFGMGMGQSLVHLAGYLILDPVVWLDRDLIAPALVYQHLLKTVIAGVLFFGFLRVRGLTVGASWLGCAVFVFSSYMCMGSCWIVNADEVVTFAFFLFALETAHRRGRWICLPFATGLLGMVSVFHFYLGALLLCFYLAERLLVRAVDPRRGLVIAARVLAAFGIGIGLGAVIWLPSLHSILNSPRGSGLISNFALGVPPTRVFQLESPLYYFTAALRPFSNDLLGSGDGFRGWENYFEAPATYCGLLPILLLPQAFVGAKKSRLLVYILFLCVAILPVVFPWFRYLFWAFRGGYFRAFSLFSVVGVITISAEVFSEYMEGRRLRWMLLGVTAVVLLLFLFFPVRQLQSLIDPNLRVAVVVFILLYASVLAAGQILKRQRVAAWISLLLATVNLVYSNNSSVNRPTVTKEDFTRRTGSNDHTVEAVREIDARQDSFFRITKMWGSGPANRISYNDALVFHYYGTPCYSSFNNIDYIRFLIGVEAIPADNIPTDAQWSPGLLWEPLLSTFVCEKYVLSEDPLRYENEDRYKFLDRFSDVYLFRNTEFLPLGLVFEDYLPESVFLKMPKWAKASALLHVAVLQDSVGLHSGLPQVTLDELHRRLRDIPIKQALSSKRESSFAMRLFRETQLEGEIQVQRPSMMIFQMPFDSGWHALVDKKPAAIARADVGLLGVQLMPGKHTVQITYFPPFLYAGLGISSVSLAVVLFAARRWPRFRR